MTTPGDAPSLDLIAEERPCLSCGYSLRGLSRDGLCPECASPIAHSLRGNLLAYSGAPYLAALHNGTFLIQASIIAHITVFILTIVGMMLLGAGGARNPAGPIGTASQILGLCVGVASIVGWWLLSSPDPAFVGAENGTNARKVVRATVVINAAIALCTALFAFGGLPPLNPRNLTASPLVLLSIAMSLAGLIAWVVWFFAAMRYLQWLAPRVPDQGLLRRASRMVWLGPLVYILGAPLCGIGPLVTLILYYNLLETLRRALKSIRAAQAAAAPA